MLEYCFIVNNSPEVYRTVSFIHHIIGWYTTSGVGIGKKAALHSYPPVQYFGNSGLVFNDLNSSKDDVISTGEDALVALYKGKPWPSEPAKVSS